MTLGERNGWEKRLESCKGNQERLINMLNDFYEAYNINENPAAYEFYQIIHAELSDCHVLV